MLGEDRTASLASCVVTRSLVGAHGGTVSGCQPWVRDGDDPWRPEPPPLCLWPGQPHGCCSTMSPTPAPRAAVHPPGGGTSAGTGAEGSHQSPLAGQPCCAQTRVPDGVRGPAPPFLPGWRCPAVSPRPVKPLVPGPHLAVLCHTVPCCWAGCAGAAGAQCPRRRAAAAECSYSLLLPPAHTSATGTCQDAAVPAVPAQGLLREAKNCS